MLHILPIELSLSVLSYLPLPTLCSLPTLSRQWSLPFRDVYMFIVVLNEQVLHNSKYRYGPMCK